mgnify:CR=1 FL=1
MLKNNKKRADYIGSFYILIYLITSESASITTGSHLEPASECIISKAFSTGMAFLYGLSDVIAEYASAAAIILEPKGIDCPFKPSGVPEPSYLSFW